MLRSLLYNFILALSFLHLHGQKQINPPDYLLQLNSKKEFDLLKGEPLSKNYHGIACVKLVVDLESNTLYYINSRRYRWHYAFTSSVLQDPDELAEFNEKNYKQTNRRYVLATLNHNANTGEYFIQFAACDNPSDKHIEVLANSLRQTSFVKGNFKLLLNSTILLKRARQLAAKYQVLQSSDLFKHQSYQPICEGKARGILKFVVADSLNQNANYSGCILVMKGSSNNIPLCSGVITSQFQTPLSHICLLAANRQTPCAAQKNIFNDPAILRYANQYVELTVAGNQLSILPAFASTAPDNKHSRKFTVLACDTTECHLATLDNLRYKDRLAYGAKACNLAELKKISFNGSHIETPQNAFAIPFCFYQQHIQASGASEIIGQLPNTPDSLIGMQLKRIQALIKKHPLNPQLADSVAARCKKFFGSAKVRFRSSSNCEDEPFFNGAGLYTSSTGLAEHPSKTYEAAIKKVWASLWSLRAYRERAHFHIVQASARMAVLVHAVFDNEAVNGVAITKNLYRNYEYGLVINLQKGEEEVVSPKPGSMCEQVISYMGNPSVTLYNESEAADWISFSGLNPGGSLLSVTELKDLSGQLLAIKSHFFKVYRQWFKPKPGDFAMDVEFKLVGGLNQKRKIVFKQARPFGR